MKSILLVPSWFPSDDDKIAGSFFREQAMMLSDEMNIQVLLLERVTYGRSKLHKIEGFPADEKLQCHKYFVRISFVERISRALQRRDLGGTFIKILCDFFDRGWIKRYRTVLSELHKTEGFKPDCVYGLSAQVSGHSALLISKAGGVPLVVAEHAPFPFPGTMVNRETRNVFEQADTVLSISNHVSRMILTQNIKCTPKVVGNLIDEQSFYPEKGKSNSKRFRIIMVGAFSFFKDHDTFFKSIKYLKDTGYDNFEVLLVGYGSLPKYSEDASGLQKILSDYGIESLVEGIPMADRQEMRALYASSQLFISSSIQETFGVACCEALACGVPVIATRSGGVEDFIDDSCGILVPIRNHVELAKAMKSVIDGERSFDTDHLREHITALYGREAFVRNMMDQFNLLCNG